VPTQFQPFLRLTLLGRLIIKPSRPTQKFQVLTAASMKAILWRCSFRLDRRVDWLWTWTQHASPKRWLLPTNPHGDLILKNIIKTVTAVCSLTESYRRFRSVCCPHHHWSVDGGSKHFCNVGKLLPDYTAKHPTRVIFRPLNASNRKLQTYVHVTFQSSHSKCYYSWTTDCVKLMNAEYGPSQSVSLRLSIRPQPTQSH
jgi:hypothetical protein